MLRTLIDETDLQPGERLLEVGSGTGVIGRWLASYTGGRNPIVGIDINRYLLREAAALARRDRLDATIDFREGSAESLPFPDSAFDVTMSVTVIEEVDADRMLAEMVRVTKPRGRVAVIARALDVPLFLNVSLTASLKVKAEAPIGVVAPSGCADTSLYRRMSQAGLTTVKMFPQLPEFGSAETDLMQFMEGLILARLEPGEIQEWRRARAEAEAEGTFFLTWPHHCAVGIKP